MYNKKFFGQDSSILVSVEAGSFCGWLATNPRIPLTVLIQGKQTPSDIQALHGKSRKNEVTHTNT